MSKFLIEPNHTNIAMFQPKHLRKIQKAYPETTIDDLIKTIQKEQVHLARNNNDITVCLTKDELKECPDVMIKAIVFPKQLCTFFEREKEISDSEEAENVFQHIEDFNMQIHEERTFKDFKNINTAFYAVMMNDVGFSKTLLD